MKSENMKETNPTYETNVNPNGTYTETFEEEFNKHIKTKEITHE